MSYPRDNLGYRRWIITRTGFTLIEVAVVMFLVALLATAGLIVLSSQVENAAYAAVKKKQEAIKDALVAYLAKYNRLPCPNVKRGGGPLTTAGVIEFSTAAPPDGFENRSTPNNVTTPCANSFGVVPYATLGLSREQALDGWENYFSYAISNTPGAPPSLNTDWSLTGNFFVGNAGGLTVTEKDTNGNVTAIPANPNAIPPTGAVAVIISHGKNRSGAFTVKGTRNDMSAMGPDELANTANPGPGQTYFRRDYTEATTGGGAFDDIVLIVGSDDLLNPLFKDGTLISKSAALNQTFSAISNAVIGATVASRIPGPPVTYTVPGAIPAGVPIVDPWGSPINLSCTPPCVFPLTIQSTATIPALAVNAFTLTSSGPDRTPNTSDDPPSYLITVVGLRGILSKQGDGF